jgi:transketolase
VEHLAGFPLSIDDLKQFRQLHSKTPGHPEYGETVGVETTTGPLGQGFGNAVGMAIAAQMEAARFENPLLLARVFVTIGDGDLMEGISAEAAALAGHLRLDNLICLFDDNTITIEGHTDLATSEDIPKRFEAHGWTVQSIDGHDPDQVRKALQNAIAATGKPKLICCKTTIGKGSPNKANTHDVHGSPLGKEEVAATKKALGLPPEDFFVDPKARAVFEQAGARNAALRKQWLADMKAWGAKAPAQAKLWNTFLSREMPGDLLDQLVASAGAEPAATRALSSNVIQKAAELVPGFTSGSADLDPSTVRR